MEESTIRWQDLPFVSQFGKVVQYSPSVTSIGVARDKVTSDTNRVTKGGFGCPDNLHSDKLFESPNLDLFSRILTAKINRVPVIIGIDRYREAS